MGTIFRTRIFQAFFIRSCWSVAHISFALEACKVLYCRSLLLDGQDMDHGDGHLVGLPKAQGLYLPEFERDSCGVGFVCHIKGKASKRIVDNALDMLERINHRGACGCEPDSGDGAGITVQIPD